MVLGVAGIYPNMTETACLCTSLRKAAHDLTRYYDDALAPAGLTVTMYRLLKQCAEAPDRTVTGLAQRLELDRSTLGRNLRVLEREQLVTFAQGKDARHREAHVTRKGQDRLRQARPLWRAAQREAGEHLPPDLVALLAQGAESLRNRHPDNRPPAG